MLVTAKNKLILYPEYGRILVRTLCQNDRSPAKDEKSHDEGLGHTSPACQGAGSERIGMLGVNGIDRLRAGYP
jgi:hypothetical protein